MEDLSKFLKNKQLGTNVLIETLIEISELGMENYRKFVDNFEMLKNVWINANFYSGTTFGQGVNFLGDDLKIWTYTPEEWREDPKLQNIVVWPLLEACHKAWLVLPDEVHDIINWKVSKIFFALLKKDYYESPETAPQNIKRFLDIDRAWVEALQKKWIKLELQFFVQKDKTTKTFQLKNQSIHIENFEKIDNKYPLKFVPYYKMMEHIQEWYLEKKDILWILGSRLKNENFTNFDRYRNPDIGKVCCSLDMALEIMDKYVADDSQWKTSQD